MKLKIDITTDNAAFEECDGIEVARILRKLADELDNNYLVLGEQPLMDANGNKVGKAKVI